MSKKINFKRSSKFNLIPLNFYWMLQEAKIKPKYLEDFIGMNINN